MLSRENIGLKGRTIMPYAEFSGRRDPVRIAGQAITGVGFLGAGVIIGYKDSIRGLTTAACAWLVCLVGLAVGAGFYLVGVAVTLLTLLALIGQHGFEVIMFRLRQDGEKKELEATFQLKVRAVRPQREILQDLLEIEGVRARESGMRTHMTGPVSLALSFLVKNADI